MKNNIYKTTSIPEKTNISNSSFVATQDNEKTNNLLSADIYYKNYLSVNLFSNINQSVEEKIDKAVLHQLHHFMDDFNTKLSTNYELQNFWQKLQPFKVSSLEEKSITLEWTLPNLNIGFDFESNEKNSFYFYTQIKEKKIRTESNELTRLKYNEIIANSIKMVIDNG